MLVHWALLIIATAVLIAPLMMPLTIALITVTRMPSFCLWYQVRIRFLFVPLYLNVRHFGHCLLM